MTTSRMTTYLDEAIAAARLREREANAASFDPKRHADVLDVGAPIDIVERLRTGPGPRVIPQIKRGVRPAATDDFSTARLASAFADAGAPLISVCTSGRDDGSFDDLTAACTGTSVPVVWSELVLSARQLVAARRARAAAVVLTVLAIEPPRLRQHVVLARRLGLAPICRAHDAAGIERALAVGADCIEVSAREPQSGAIDLERACGLRHLVPHRIAYLIGGGIADHGQLVAMRGRDIDGVVVGRHLMQADDPGLALMALAAY